MKLLSFLTSAAIIGACALNTNTASAQGTPILSGNRLTGYQTDVPFLIEAGNWTIPSPYIEMTNHTSTNQETAGALLYIAGYNSSNMAGISHSFYSRTSTLGWVSHMRILQNGQVQIGEQAPSSSQADYKLAVDGKFVAKSIYVTAPGTWADFVFDSTYTLMKLDELENYIRANSHLPNIPSAQEVKEKGIDIGEMNAKLLEKIEELTLHVIELKKENDKVKEQLEALKEQFRSNKN